MDDKELTYHPTEATELRPFAVMPEVEAIRTHPLYRKWYARLKDCETDREYCRHGADHLIGAARIAYIMVLEQGLPYSKELIYATALLHDIGKAAQYECGDPHEVVGEGIARQILSDIDGFTDQEKEQIVHAVREHRRYDRSSSELGRILYAADKASRLCFDCDARGTCSWPDEKKNMNVRI
ncbi:HD domain-containing protein [Slackia heliotrinireducens]|jgi:putative nucleotidyltransferase with HDIG domain|uniref:HD domain-containing protein n=1 Tax=Slackia heliotrinireducens TaxID=84110 RepID=UPI00331500E0